MVGGGGRLVAGETVRSIHSRVVKLGRQPPARAVAPGTGGRVVVRGNDITVTAGAVGRTQHTVIDSHQ